MFGNFKYFGKVLYILGASKKTLLLLVTSFLLVSALETFGIGLIGPFITIAANPSVISQTEWLNALYINSGIKEINQFIALSGFLIVILFCTKSLISWKVQNYVFIFSYIQQGVLSTRLMHSYLSAPYVFHLSKNTAQIIQNIVSETKLFANNVIITLLTSIANIIIIVLLSVLLCLTDAMAVIGILILTLPLFVVFHYFKDKLTYWGKDASQAEESIVRMINHGLGGIKETQVLGCANYFEEKVKEQAQRYANASGAYYAFRLSPRILIETLLVIFLVGFISILLLFNRDTKELTAILGIFAIASIRLIPAISNLMSGIGGLRNSSYVVNKLYVDLKELESLNKDNHTKKTRNLISGEKDISLEDSEHKNFILFSSEIILESIVYSYPNAAKNSLNELSLSIKKGESIALIGKSGAGKTTLVDVILGLLTPQKGDIKVDGKSIYKNLRSWQNLIGYIPQSIFLLDDTIEKNIAFGVPDFLIDSQRLQKAIKAAQLEELIESLPEGLKTMVGERGVLLSGGQRQRIGIARALYHERDILVLDEATAALDNQTEALVTEAIQSLSGIKTMIIIAHRLTTVEHCDRIYLMEQGKIIKSGTYQEVVLSNLN